jgi:hypothetical protein
VPQCVILSQHANLKGDQEHNSTTRGKSLFNSYEVLQMASIFCLKIGLKDTLEFRYAKCVVPKLLLCHQHKVPEE